MAQLSRLEQLPNEILDLIVSNLATDPPSLSRLNRLPSVDIASSDTKDLKNTSLASSRLRHIARPFLFSHVVLHLGSEDEFLSFISRSGLGRHVTSTAVIVSGPWEMRVNPFWWQSVLTCVDPQHITLIATPSFMEATLRVSFESSDSWAFDIPLQILHLERDRQQRNADQSVQLGKQPSLLAARKWTTMLFNEGSSLTAYSHYEYFHLRIPSLFNSLSDVESIRPYLGNLVSFHYVAIFPFLEHMTRVGKATRMMPNLQSVSVQLVPDQRDDVQIDAKGPVDASDPWMEVESGYTVFLCTLSDTPASHLKKVVAYDYDRLRTERSGVLWEALDRIGWVHDGHGTWTRD